MMTTGAILGPPRAILVPTASDGRSPLPSVYVDLDAAAADNGLGAKALAART